MPVPYKPRNYDVPVTPKTPTAGRWGFDQRTMTPIWIPGARPNAQPLRTPIRSGVGAGVTYRVYMPVVFPAKHKATPADWNWIKSYDYPVQSSNNSGNSAGNNSGGGNYSGGYGGGNYYSRPGRGGGGGGGGGYTEDVTAPRWLMDMVMWRI